MWCDNEYNHWLTDWHDFLFNVITPTAKSSKEGGDLGEVASWCSRNSDELELS